MLTTRAFHLVNLHRQRQLHCCCTLPMVHYSTLSYARFAVGKCTPFCLHTQSHTRLHLSGARWGLVANSSTQSPEPVASPSPSPSSSPTSSTAMGSRVLVRQVFPHNPKGAWVILGLDHTRKDNGSETPSIVESCIRKKELPSRNLSIELHQESAQRMWEYERVYSALHQAFVPSGFPSSVDPSFASYCKVFFQTLYS